MQRSELGRHRSVLGSGFMVSALISPSPELCVEKHSCCGTLCSGTLGSRCCVITALHQCCTCLTPVPGTRA